MKRTHLVLLLLAASGFALRAAFILISNDYTNPVAYESGSIAENIASGKGYVFQHWTAGRVEPTAWVPCFYPLFLAFFFKWFGLHAFLAIELVQGLALSCLAYPAYGLGRLLHSPKVGWVAAGLVTLYPPFIYYARAITYDGLFLLFTALSLYGLVSLSVSPRAPKALVTGLLLGLANLTKSILLPFSLSALLWLAWSSGNAKWRYPLIVGISCLLTITPWSLRNYVVFQRLIPLQSSFGFMLWLGNRPGFPGVFDPARRYEGTGLRRLTQEEKTLLRGMGEIERNDYLFHQAKRYILEDPKAFLERTLVRMTAFWWISERFARGEPLKEGSSEEAAFFIGLRKLNLALLYCFGLAGLFLSRDRKKIHTLFFLLFLTLTVLNALTQSSLSRYQLPVEFPIVIYAAIAAVFLWEKTVPKFLPSPSS